MTRPPLCSGRDTSPFRALALETACADSRAPDGLSLRSRPSGRAREIEHLAGKNGKPAVEEETPPAATEDDEIPF